ncbi:MAG: PAS domain-containing sensor histidine kinase [Gemmatirosa sp.]
MSAPRGGRAPGWLFDSIGEGVFVLDHDWRLTYVNAAAERITGAQRDGMIGREVWELFPTIAGSPVDRAWRTTMGDRKPMSLRTVPLPAQVGGPTAGIFDMRSYPVEESAGGGGVVVLFTEVSRREREQRALAARSEENERLRELARAMAAVADSGTLLDELCTAALALCDADGATVAQIAESDGTFVASLGHPANVRGHTFPLAGTLTGRLLAAFRTSGRAELLRVDASEADDAALCGQLADERRVGAILMAPLAAHGELLGVLAISRAEERPRFGAHDAQLLRVVADHASLALWKARLVEAAHAASRTSSSFLATVSHELRTPLTALTGYGELLADEILGPMTTDQHDVVERMRGVTHQLTGMIEEILTFSSLEAGRELVRCVPVDVAEVVHSVVTVVEPLAQQKGLAFTVDVPPVAPPLTTDPDKLRQILVNLGGNAVKFTERGSVRLTVTAHGREVRFALSDTGVGIARADLGRLFKPFSQLDTGLTRRYGGTGLGLHISRRLAQLLGGTIVVESEPGVGSTFTVVLNA